VNGLPTPRPRSRYHNRLGVHYPKKEDIKLEVKRGRIPYKEVEAAILKGKGVFLEGLKRNTAYDAAKIISRHLKEEFIAVPAIVEINKVSIRGYTFEKKKELTLP
jgi:hypothetical protein